MSGRCVDLEGFVVEALHREFRYIGYADCGDRKVNVTTVHSG
jgi:hypothetical protein